MSLRLFCQQWRAHMLPEIHTQACRMETQPLSVAVVCLLWRGVTMDQACARMCMREYGLVSCLFVFFCSSILLDFWAQSVVHMVLAALWMANVSVMLKPVRQEIGRVFDRKTGWGQRQRVAMIHWVLAFCLPSDATGMQVVNLKCLHGWLIKSEKLLLLINWQAQPHVSAYSHPCMNRLHNVGPSAICLICLYLDSSEIVRKDFTLKSDSLIFIASRQFLLTFARRNWLWKKIL